MIILADSTGTELRAVKFLEYDFEVGDFENSFLVTGNRSEWEAVPDKARIYIPGTEYGGIYDHLETDTKNGTFGLGGYTWRGMLQNKVIQPAPGADYATDSGELNAVIKARVEAALPGLFTGTSESTGVTVSYQYNRRTGQMLTTHKHSRQEEHRQALATARRSEIRSTLTVTIYINM
jgi:hypothetical protein